MSILRTAVIGVGYLGNFHAQKYASLDHVELVGVVDADMARATEVASACGCKAFSDYQSLLGQVDAVSVVVPTQMHHQVAKDFLEAGVHVLIEKPITVTVEQADELIALADTKKLVIQVGNFERFNPVLMASGEALTGPLFVDSVRIAPFKPRETDVNVVLNLMIHDIEIIQHLVKSPVASIDAVVAPVLTGEEDIANVTASRISFKSERKMRIFQRDSYLTLDFQNKKLMIAKKGSGEMLPGVPNISIHEEEFGQSDPLLEEVSSFVSAINQGTQPLVSGNDGRMALETALTINKSFVRF